MKEFELDNNEKLLVKLEVLRKQSEVCLYLNSKFGQDVLKLGLKGPGSEMWAEDFFNKFSLEKAKEYRELMIKNHL